MAQPPLLPWTALPEALARHCCKAGLTIAVPAGPEHPALAWRRSGLLDVTGRADAPGLVAPAALTVLADAALAALGAAREQAFHFSGALLLGERARLIGLRRQGSTSPNGSCRLLPALDGTIALNLPRAGDLDLAGALVGERVAGWEDVAAGVAAHTVADLLERGRLLGLAIAAVAPPPPDPSPFTIRDAGVRGRAPDRPPLVVDLSALWAGPLAGSLLALAGAEVVKVESTRRPDGARFGHAGFYALLNRDKQDLSLDLSAPGGQAALRDLVGRADIVIEASRPRALRAMGVVAEDFFARGGTWLSITGHGREGDAAEAIGFGDDAAVAGGLAWRMARAWGEPLFAGDAIADPLTGLLGALLAWRSWQEGGGRLIDLALSRSVAFACGFGTQDVGRWQDLALADAMPLYPLRT